MTDRRQFLQLAVGTAGLVGLHAAGLTRSARAADPVQPAGKPLSILFLGGTGFIGPHQVEHALARGHRVTIFNRGRKSGLFGDRVEELTGNRDSKIDDGLTALEGDRTWDVVIDNSGYVPRHVRDSVELLADRCERYIYISTVAVYPDEAGVFPEDAPLAPLSDPAVEDVTWETYGSLKAECDRIVREKLGARATVVRPTYIVGPGDTTDRFTYWVDRLHRGGKVVGPAHGDVAVQVVDVRDLCPWLVTLAEDGTPGAFNAAGPAFTRAGLLWGIRATTDADVHFHWLTPELAAELEMPTPMLDWGTASSVFPGAASEAAGLHYRALMDSALGTLAWWREQPAERREKARGWPTAEQEKAALARLEG
jgi:2'-hydroxyisoflavone reductase